MVKPETGFLGQKFFIYPLSQGKDPTDGQGPILKA
jgi:hypothetical protein